MGNYLAADNLDPLSYPFVLEANWSFTIASLISA
jgi:hypothetical protein